MKPILFNTEMVQAILEGRKTVTRRVVKLPQYIQLEDDGTYTLMADGDVYEEQVFEQIIDYVKNPFQVGDILYVRETWQILPSGFDEIPPEMNCIYKATHELSKECTKWRSSIHMPKEYARIFLKVTNVRVERLQDITRDDIVKEGFKDYGFQNSVPYFVKFINLWDSIIKNDAYKWENNPWVLVIAFEREEER